jgi:hypothetical protein
MTSRPVRLLARAALAAVVAVAVAPFIGTTAAEATSGACPRGTGVTVVVGSQVACDTSGGGVAATKFTNVGHVLTYTVRFPGMVCRVDGAPSSAGCVNAPPADAYWALFWSNGTSGTWTYANLGVTSLQIPTGGWVAWVFQNTNSTVPPSVTPLGPVPAAATSAAPSSGKTAAAAQPTTSSKTASATTSSASASASASAGPTTAAASPSASADQTPGAASASTRTTANETGDSRWFGWATAAVALVGVAGAGGYTWWRRRTT